MAKTQTALKGGKNMTTGNPLVLMLLFALPLFLGNVFQQMYSTVDTAIVGRVMGANQLAAVGSTGSLSWLLLGFTFGLTGGYGILVSQAYGAGDIKKIRKVIGNAILLSAIILIIFIPIALIIIKPVLKLMNTPEEILSDAVIYISIILGGAGCTMLYNVMSSLLRAVGDAKTPLFFLILSSLLNVGLDFLFILTFKLGVAGAALATILSQIISGVLCIFYARQRYEIFRLSKEDFKFDKSIIRQLLSLGLPMAFQSSLTAAGMLIMQYSINGFGPAIIASYTVAHKVEAIVSMLTMSLGPTIATYVGQNYGAKQTKRLFLGVRIAALIAFIYAVISALIIIFLGVPILMIFIDSNEKNIPEIVDAGMLYLKVFACFLLPYNWLIVFRQSLQGIGKSIYTLVGGTMECIMRIAVSLTLPGMIGYLGCCLAGPAAWVGAIIPLLIAYFYEKRKLFQTR